MRGIAPVLLLAAALGAGLWWLLSDPEPDLRQPRAEKGPGELEIEAQPHLGFKSERLVLRAKTYDGRVPVGLELGFVAAADRETLYADDFGTREFKAPVGRVEVFARAPGYREARLPVEVLAGVPAEAALVLERE